MLMSRRCFIASSGALAVLPSASLALDQAGARRLINSVVNEINGVIDSGKSETAMFRDFEALFRRYADTSFIAASAMGPDGRRASGAQKKAFSDAFIAYLSRRYGARFREFSGGRFEVQGVKAVRNYYEVKSLAFLPGSSSFDVTFLVSDRTGKDLFFNIFVEGINMLLTERTEVGALLDKNRGNIDAMIDDLRKAG